jgi:tetratricopeptide (TPR) repeat protein
VYSQLVLCERYVYLAQMGVALAMSSVLLTFGKHGKVAIVALTLAACVFTISNNTIWKDDISYWSYISKSNPSDAGAVNNLATAYMQAGQIDDAIPLYEKASRAEPNNAIGHANLGGLYLQVGRVGDAIRELEAAHKLAPGNPDIEGLLEQARQSGGR